MFCFVWTHLVHILIIRSPSYHNYVMCCVIDTTFRTNRYLIYYSIFYNRCIIHSFGKRRTLKNRLHYECFFLLWSFLCYTGTWLLIASSLYCKGRSNLMCDTFKFGLFQFEYYFQVWRLTLHSEYVSMKNFNYGGSHELSQINQVFLLFCYWCNSRPFSFFCSKSYY